MQSAIPAQERPARNVLIAVSHYARITPSHVERVARFSAHPAVSYIERSILSLYIGNVESEKGLNAGFGCSELFPISEGHKLIQNFLQSLESPFVIGGCSSISPVDLGAVRFTDLGYFFPKFLDTL
jgi:hypothetical protein